MYSVLTLKGLYQRLPLNQKFVVIWLCH